MEQANYSRDTICVGGKCQEVVKLIKDTTGNYLAGLACITILKQKINQKLSPEVQKYKKMYAYN